MSLNAYVYALSNPLSWIDPLGLSPVDASPMMAPSSESKINTSFLGGFAKGFVRTAAAAAVGIVAVATAPLATALVGTGLAVYGTVSNYRQRAAEQTAAGQTAAGQKVNKVGTFFAALGDTLGVSGLIEGITGKRMLTGQKLSSAQAGEKLGGGVASVAAMVAGPALVKTIRPVVSKIVEPIKAAVVNAVAPVARAVGSFFSKIGAGLKALVVDQAGGINAGAPRTVDFLVSKGGTAVPVPKGATGPGPTDTGKGFSFTGGSGGHGLSSKVSGVRIMDTTTRYPGGYAVYMNGEGQTVNPLTGRTTLGKADPWGHIPLK
jgi:hypothetical protein